VQVCAAHLDALHGHQIPLQTDRVRYRAGNVVLRDCNSAAAPTWKNGRVQVRERGSLQVTIGRDPLAIEIRRGRRLIRGMTPWAAAGESRDRFIQLTEGVIAAEQLERRRPLREAQVELHDERVTIEFAAPAGAFRLGADWEARPGERFTGLGARHGEQVDQTGRRVRLGADRRYTGPDCPPDMLEVGGIPQGDYAPVPWLLASRGYALWLETGGRDVSFAVT
jgi:hypothetical protein